MARASWHPVRRKNYDGPLPWAVVKGVWQEGQFRTRAEAQVAANHRKAEDGRRSTDGRSRWSRNPARNKRTGRFMKKR